MPLGLELAVNTTACFDLEQGKFTYFPAGCAEILWNDIGDHLITLLSIVANWKDRTFIDTWTDPERGMLIAAIVIYAVSTIAIGVVVVMYCTSLFFLNSQSLTSLVFQVHYDRHEGPQGWTTNQGLTPHRHFALAPLCYRYCHFSFQHARDSLIRPR